MVLRSKPLFIYIYPSPSLSLALALSLSNRTGLVRTAVPTAASYLQCAAGRRRRPEARTYHLRGQGRRRLRGDADRAAVRRF